MNIKYSRVISPIMSGTIKTEKWIDQTGKSGGLMEKNINNKPR